MKLCKPLLNSLMLAAIFMHPALAEETQVSHVYEARINMLEKAFAPQTSKELAILFAQANKTRNGAVQYMLFSDSVKKDFKDTWPNWVSGTSSPWITSFDIKEEIKNKEKSTFKIQYKWATADGPFKPDLIQEILVEAVPTNSDSTQKFWISAFKEVEASK